MFLKPGSIVVEIVGQFDGRMPPLCGFHGPLASVYDIHHYVSFCCVEVFVAGKFMQPTVFTSLLLNMIVFHGRYTIMMHLGNKTLILHNWRMRSGRMLTSLNAPTMTSLAFHIFPHNTMTRPLICFRFNSFSWDKEMPFELNINHLCINYKYHKQEITAYIIFYSR